MTAASTLREGDPKALTFYLDHGRAHVGDLARTTEDAFAAPVQWAKPLAGLGGRPVHLEFALKSASLFAFSLEK